MIPPATSDSSLLREHAFYDTGNLKYSLGSKFDYYQNTLNESETASTIFAILLIITLVLMFLNFVPIIRHMHRHQVQREKHGSVEMV